MRFAAYLTFDSASNAVLQTLRETLTQHIPGIPSPNGKMAPHLTLLVFDADDPQSVITQFEPLSRNSESIPITLVDIGSFTGKRNVLYVKPLLAASLKNQQQRCFDSYAAVMPVRQYRIPLHWKPHVTLAKGIDDATLEKATALAQTLWKPRQAHSAAIGLINVQKPLEPLSLHSFLPPP